MDEGRGPDFTRETVFPCKWRGRRIGRRVIRDTPRIRGCLATYEHTGASLVSQARGRDILDPRSDVTLFFPRDLLPRIYHQRFISTENRKEIKSGTLISFTVP